MRSWKSFAAGLSLPPASRIAAQACSVMVSSTRRNNARQRARRSATFVLEESCIVISFLAGWLGCEMFAGVVCQRDKPLSRDGEGRAVMKSWIQAVVDLRLLRRRYQVARDTPSAFQGFCRARLRASN